MAVGFQLGALTIYRVVEQEAALFDALPFFPTLTEEMLAENLRGCSRYTLTSPADSSSAYKATSCRRRTTSF